MTTHEELVVAAKQRATDHWPDRHGLCPVCHVARCRPWTEARNWLEEFAVPPEPIIRPRP